MQNPPMKGILSLDPFSRDHGVALVCAEQARKAVRASNTEQAEMIEQIRSSCHKTIIGYLNDEQSILLPLIRDPYLCATFNEKQKNIRQLVDKLDAIDRSEEHAQGVLSMLADALDDYVRWEEHTLFPRIEQRIDRKQLLQLSKQTKILEANRSRPTQRLHSSVEGPASRRRLTSLAHALLVVSLAAVVLNLIMAALGICSVEWLRMRVRTWRKTSRSA